MGFKCGIIGLPNVGKSTLFNALTNKDVTVANYPFCTIDPNKGIVKVPDERLDKIAEIVKPKHILSTSMEFVDIAGLVQGASTGKGLGNQFLNHIRDVAIIGHVVRCFNQHNIFHVTKEVDPIKDINIVNTELILADLNICEQAIFRLHNQKKNKKDKDIQKKLEILKKCLYFLENSCMLHSVHFEKKEKELIHYLNFLTLKPTMYIANIHENNCKNNWHFSQLYDFSKKERCLLLPICAKAEAEIVKLQKEDHTILMKELGVKELSLNRIIRIGYMLLNLHTYFTVGAKEVRAWTIPINSTALQAARKIHSDFQKGFIRAQTISYKDFIKYKGEQGVREAGKIRSEGKNYLVKDGDIIHFFFKI